MRRYGKYRSYRKAATPYRQGSSFTMPYKDTVIVNQSLLAGNSSIVFNAQDLFPGLQTSADNLRNIVITKVLFEVMPPPTEAVSCQACIDDGILSPATATGMAPFKVASQVNPTMYVIDVKRFARKVPTALALTSAASPTNRIRFKVNSQSDTQLYIRVTSFCDVFPQEDAVPVTPPVV